MSFGGSILIYNITPFYLFKQILCFKSGRQLIVLNEHKLLLSIPFIGKTSIWSLDSYQIVAKVKFPIKVQRLDPMDENLKTSKNIRNYIF